MQRRWDQEGLPHKGWDCEHTIDLGADGPMDDSDYATCQMCGQEKIRFVHVMCHPKVEEQLSVGCICAGKMTGDYEAAERREAVLKNKAARKARWLTRKWRLSTKGNPYLNIDGNNIGVHRKGTRWAYRIDQSFGIDVYESEAEAKLALFEAYWQKINSN